MLYLDCWKSMKYYRKDQGMLEDISEVEISISGKFRIKRSKRDISVYNIGQGYPGILLIRDGRISRYRAHVAMISSFGSYDFSKSGLVVDHINRDICDYRLCNLRLVTVTENNKNRVVFKKSRAYILVNSNGNIIKSATFPNEGSKLYTTLNRFRENRKDYLVISLSEDCFSKIKNVNNISYLLNQTWKKVGTSNLYVGENGLLKMSTNFGLYLSFGSINKNGYYVFNNRTARKDNSQYVHILVAKYFLNSGQSIDSKKFSVDHIDTNKENNNYHNLRIVSLKDNINNQNTKIKQERSISINYLGEIYKIRSVLEFSRMTGHSRSSIMKWISDGINMRGPAEILEIKYISEEEKYDAFNNNEFIDDINFLKFTSIEDLKSIRSINEFIKENKIRDISLLKIQLLNQIKDLGLLDSIKLYSE